MAKTFIPNSQIIKALLFNNALDGFLRYEILMSFDYSTELNNAITLILSVLNNMPDVLQGDKKPVIVVEELAVSTVNVRILYWIDTFKSKSSAFHSNIKSIVIIKLLEEFGKNNIYLPAEIVGIRNCKDTVLDT